MGIHWPISWASPQMVQLVTCKTEECEGWPIDSLVGNLPSVSVKISSCLESNLFCANKALSKPTLWWEGDAGLAGASSKKGKCAESPPTFIRGKRRKNRKRRGLRTLSVKGSGVVFTHGEDISTPRVHHKGRQPLIECAKMTSNCFIFPFFMFMSFYALFCIFIFLWSTRVFSLPLHIPQLW